MKTQTSPIDKLVTERLTLIPFTITICKNFIRHNFSDLPSMGLKQGKSWPDDDVLETLPRIIDNLSKVAAPTGFESWMIIKNDTAEIIGDIGFKGLNNQEQIIDIGYGIIKEERRNGYAEEAATGLIKWAFSTEMVKAITANCLLDNHSSINLLRKLNFTETRRDDEMIYWIITSNFNQ